MPKELSTLGAPIKSTYEGEPGAWTAEKEIEVKARGNHTGTQAIGTITGLQTALDNKVNTSQMTAALAALVDGSPGALDTLNELAAALGDDPNFAATITTLIGTKANKLLAVRLETATYTPDLNDEAVEINAAGAVDFIVPPNSTVAFDIGKQLLVGQAGAGQITIVAGAGVTLRYSETLKTKKQWAQIALYQRAANEWWVSGNTESA